MTERFEWANFSSIPNLKGLPDGQGVAFLANDGRRVVVLGVGLKDRVFRSEKFWLA
jgi:hypothetical protein